MLAFGDVGDLQETHATLAGLERVSCREGLHRTEVNERLNRRVFDQLDHLLRTQSIPLHDSQGHGFHSHAKDGFGIIFDDVPAFPFDAFDIGQKPLFIAVNI